MSQVNVRGGLAAPTSATARRRGIRRLSKPPTWLLFLLPGLVLFTAFIVWPMLYSLRISFYQWNIVHPEQSIGVGLQNYSDALNDPIFQRSALNTLLYGLITVPGQIVLGTLA